MGDRFMEFCTFLHEMQNTLGYKDAVCLTIGDKPALEVLASDGYMVGKIDPVMVFQEYDEDIIIRFTGGDKLDRRFPMVLDVLVTHDPARPVASLHKVVSRTLDPVVVALVYRSADIADGCKGGELKCS